MEKSDTSSYSICVFETDASASAIELEGIPSPRSKASPLSLVVIISSNRVFQHGVSCSGEEILKKSEPGADFLLGGGGGGGGGLRRIGPGLIVDP